MTADDLGALAVLVLGIVIATALIVLGVRQIVHHVDQGTCRSYASTSGRDVRFIDHTFWSWDCYVVTPDGLVQHDRVVEVPR